MDLEVVPDNWTLSNRIGFNKYAYETFHPSKYPIKQVKKACECSKDKCDVSSDAISLFPQQRIVRDFIQINSPYRGIILYHELGSGKSAASIAAAEGYIDRKKVFIITPASLAQNYENELMKISKIGLSMKKSWTLIKVSDKKEVSKKYAISEKLVKKNMIWVPLYQNDIHNATIIKEKVSYNSLNREDKETVNEIIKDIINNRYNFISYNGLTRNNVNEYKKKGFDNSFIVIDEVHNFISRVVNGSKLARTIYNLLMSAKDCKFVLLSGTPIINNPYEIASLINLIRGEMKEYTIKLLKTSVEKTTKELENVLAKNNLLKYTDTINYSSSKKEIKLTLLPNGYVKEKNAIIFQKWQSSENKLLEEIVEVFNKEKGLKVGVKVTNNNFYALPANQEEFNKIFIDTSDSDNLAVKNIDLFQRRILGTLSYYKTSGTEFFPEVLPNKIQYLDMTPHQLNIYADVREKERKIDDVQNKKAKINKGNNLLGEKSSVYRAFSRMVCNFSFPEKIKREFPQDIRAVLKKELNIDDDDEDENDKDKELLKNIKTEYEKSLNNSISELDKGDYLSIENLSQHYSPKYAKMIQDIEDSPGTVLVYSQFRTAEGLGIFSKSLDKNGYKEITIKKTDKGYVLEDPSVLDKQYDNRRYVIFNSDRMKTNILMNLFNGSYSLLPESILEQLTDRDQLYGKLVKIMMITQSGAEGISLKNVRRVLIMEYFWNSVRIDQVIGRAVRTCSHETLPVSDRNVQIFTYIMKLTPKQLEKDFTLKTKDNGFTTDEHILNIANKKKSIIQEFLNMLKSASFDCIINSIQNKPLQNGYKCYNWAVNVNEDDLSYTSNISDDKKIQKHQKLQVSRKGKGQVVIKNNEKYVLLNNKLYDYFSYKNAGILLKI